MKKLIATITILFPISSINVNADNIQIASLPSNAIAEDRLPAVANFIFSI